jgi:hypothetical protein
VNAAKTATGKAKTQALKNLSIYPSCIPVPAAVTTAHIITLMPKDIIIMYKF